MPLPMLVGAASAALPSLVDLISGASADRRNALNKRNAGLDAIIGDTRREIGPNVTESTGFKTGMGLLDRQFQKRQRMVQGRSIASGATPEANAGMMEALHAANNTGALQVLMGATRRRDLLKDRMNNLLMQRANLDVQDANETLGAQGKWTQGITTTLPYLFDFNGNKTNVEKP